MKYYTFVIPLYIDTFPSVLRFYYLANCVFSLSCLLGSRLVWHFLRLSQILPSCQVKLLLLHSPQSSPYSRTSSRIYTPTQHVELLKVSYSFLPTIFADFFCLLSHAATRPQQTSYVAACPSQQNTPAVVCGLSTPSSKAALDEVGDWEEVGGEGLSSNEYMDFGNWSLIPSFRKILVCNYIRCYCCSPCWWYSAFTFCCFYKFLCFCFVCVSDFYAPVFPLTLILPINSVDPRLVTVPTRLLSTLCAACLTVYTYLGYLLSMFGICYD